MKQTNIDTRKALLPEKKFGFCPGCGHGIVTRLIAEVIDELDIRDRTISISGIGCGLMASHCLDIDSIEAMHGRAPAVATGYKLAAPPHRIVYTYQGDGDMASIGLAEIIHSANRGFPITGIMVNNGVFGMTGGQMSYCTLEGQKTLTTPFGREPGIHGYPIRLPEMLKETTAPGYVARGSLSTPKQVIKTKKWLKKAFEFQVEEKGFSFMEILSPCVTALGRSPVESYQWVKEEMEAYYPTGVFKEGEV